MFSKTLQIFAKFKKDANIWETSTNFREVFHTLGKFPELGGISKSSEKFLEIQISHPSSAKLTESGSSYEETYPNITEVL